MKKEMFYYSLGERNNAFGVALHVNVKCTVRLTEDKMLIFLTFFKNVELSC